MLCQLFSPLKMVLFFVNRLLSRCRGVNLCVRITSPIESVMGEGVPDRDVWGVNPENALGEYRFEYGPCEKLATCATAKTDVLSSSVWHKWCAGGS